MSGQLVVREMQLVEGRREEVEEHAHDRGGDRQKQRDEVVVVPHEELQEEDRVSSRGSERCAE